MNESVDTDTLSMLKEVMEDDFQLLVSTFLDDAQLRIPQLFEEFNAGDGDMLRQTAHSLKGSSSNLGAVRLSELCFQVEHRAKENQLDGLEAVLYQVKAEFDQVRSILEGL